ncbi:MAG TPA: hypothetical protein VKR53_17190 [Puia sp.]|nr:hypothetical protein [Puia sp.]
MEQHFTLLKRGYLTFSFRLFPGNFIDFQKGRVQVCASANNIFGMDAGGDI